MATLRILLSQQAKLLSAEVRYLGRKSPISLGSDDTAHRASSPTKTRGLRSLLHYWTDTEFCCPDSFIIPKLAEIRCLSRIPLHWEYGERRCALNCRCAE